MRRAWAGVSLQAAQVRSGVQRMGSGPAVHLGGRGRNGGDMVTWELADDR